MYIVVSAVGTYVVFCYVTFVESHRTAEDCHKSCPWLRFGRKEAARLHPDSQCSTKNNCFQRAKSMIRRNEGKLVVGDGDGAMQVISTFLELSSAVP